MTQIGQKCVIEPTTPDLLRYWFQTKGANEMQGDYAHSESSKARLKRSYLELYLKQNGKDVYPSLVAQNAHMSRRTFYRHYPNLAALRAEAFDDALPREFCQRVYSERATIPLEIASDGIIRFYEERPLATRVFLGHDVDREFEFETAKLLKLLFRGLVERSFILDSSQADVLMESLTYARLSLIRLWAQRGCTPSLSEMNRLADNVMERSFWVQIARAIDPEYGKLSFTSDELSLYPWHPEGEYR